MKAKPELIVETPWSTVMRFETDDGFVYSKQTPEALALEAPIIQKLREDFQASVPDIIEYDPSKYIFWMKDAGGSLRTVLTEKFQLDLILKSVAQFTALQEQVANHVDEFIEMGVPDWRLDRLPALFAELLEQTDLLGREGLSSCEIRKLKALLPMIRERCDQLSQSKIRESIVQPDFHDNNILIDEATGKLTFIDLGELVISHPLFSLVNFVFQVGKHHGEANQLVLIEKLNFSLEYPVAESVWPVYGALAQYRLRLACDEAEFEKRQPYGKLGDLLKVFLKGINDESSI